MQTELLEKYHPSMLQLLKIQGLGPKTIALIWSAYKVSDVDGVEKLAREGKIRELPAHGREARSKAAQSHRGLPPHLRTLPHRRRRDARPKRLIEHLANIPASTRSRPPARCAAAATPSAISTSSLPERPAATTEGRQAAIDHVCEYPRSDGRHRQRRQQSQLPPARRHASRRAPAAARIVRRGHAVLHRIEGPQRRPAPARPQDGLHAQRIQPGHARRREAPVAGKTEEEIYAKLKLDYIPPEMRENLGEIDLAEAHALPELITQADMQGDVHMHTVETDGRNTIEEMAEAAKARGYNTWPSPTTPRIWPSPTDSTTSARSNTSLAFAPPTRRSTALRIFAGIEVDILADGDSRSLRRVLAQMDVVIASVHSVFNQEPAKMTERLLRAIENPNTSLIGHPTGRIQLRRDAYPFDMHAVLTAAAKHKVAMELNSYPDRLDLNDVHLRQAKQRGVKIVINTDSHHTSHMEKIRYGVLQARRAWLTKDDVLNTLPAPKFAKAMKHAW